MKEKKKSYFFNPVAVIPDNGQLIAAIIIFITSLLISYFLHVANDGIFHGTFIQRQSIVFLLLSNALVILLPAAFLFIAGKLFNKGVRFTDMCNAVLFSRLPLLIAYAIIFYFIDVAQLSDLLQAKGPQALNQLGKGTQLKLQAVSLFTLPFIIYSFIVLINGFKTAMYAKKPVHYISFVLGLIIAGTGYRLVIYPVLLHLSK